MGGLLTLNSYMNKFSVFNIYIAIDPSIWWNEEMMKNKFDSISSKSLNKKKIYIATANQGDANYERNKKRHDDFYTLIIKKSGEPINVAIEYFEKENHRSVLLVALFEGLTYINQDN